MVFLPADRTSITLCFYNQNKLRSLTECQQVIIILIETGVQYLCLMGEFITWSKKLDGNEGVKCNEYLCGFPLPFWSRVPGFG